MNAQQTANDGVEPTRTVHPVLSNHHDVTPHDEVEDDEEFSPELVTRWKRMGAAALVLLAVVAYLYETKIDAPIERLEQNIESQVVNRPQPTQQVLQVPDEAPQKPDLTLVNTAKAANPLNDGVLSASVTCPAGTTRMIYIDDQALCCQGKQCSEAQ